MAKDAAITIRLPVSLKRQLETRARAERRSLSAQVVADLERVVSERAAPAAASGKLLGLFSGASVPSEADIEEVRHLLWGGLGRGVAGS